MSCWPRQCSCEELPQPLRRSFAAVFVGVGAAKMWKSLVDELREMIWLASMIGGLSALGAGLAVAFAAA